MLEFVEIGRETLTVSSSVASLTPPLKGQLTRAVARLTSGLARWTGDGTSPVAYTTGYLLFPGDALIIEGPSTLAAFRITRELPVNASLAVEYQGYAA